MYCKKCISKKICSSETWRLKNSKAQLIAQNKPEVKEKNRASVILAHKKDPSISAKKREASLRLWKTEEYSNKVQSNCNKRRLSGVFDGLLFSSSYELSYLIYCDQNNIFVERSRFVVPYKDEGNKERLYLPDYFVKKTKVVEIKGGFTKNVKLKAESAKKFFSELNLEYDLLFIDDLLSLGCVQIKDIYKIKEIKKSMEKELQLKQSQNSGKLILSKIVEKKESTYKGKVYDLHVKDSHSYTVDNLVVHNSAGASLIFYLLGVTRVDPVQWNFPFERFINDRKTALDSEKVRLLLRDGGTVDLSPNSTVKLTNGVAKLAKELKPGDDVEL